MTFSAQTAVPSSGLVYLNPMDTGSVNLSGVALTFGGLGNGTSATGLGTGTVTNSGAAANLTLNVNTTNSQFNGLLSGAINLVKSGTGTQILGFNNFAGTGGNTYTGTTTVNAGQITSATGLFTPLGSLTGTGVNSFGTGGITLAGGQINFNSTAAASEVDHGIGITTQGPNNGYDITIAALNNFGTANTTSTLATANTGPWQGINSLNILSSNVNFGGTSGNGVLVKGQTTFAGNTTINTAAQAVLSGKLAATGLTLTKIGANALFLTNTELGAGASSVGAWNLMQGTTEVRLSDGGSNPLGGTTVTLNGATLNLRHDGDNLSDPQTLTTFNTDTIVVGSTTAASSPNYITSINAVLDGRTLSGGNNKTLQVQQINYGGPLGAAFLTYTGANNYTIEVTNGITMVKDAYLGMTNNALTIDTQLSGNGTFFKQGGAELDLNTVATNTGGTMLFQGTTNFGSFIGNTRTLSTTAKFAPGDLTVNIGTVLRFNSSGNINGTQRIDARSNLNFYPVIGIGSNEPISSFNLRVPLAAGPSASSLITPFNTGSGVLEINNPAYTQTLDLSKIGDGTWYVGSNNNAAGVNAQTSAEGVYTGSGAILSSPAAYNFGVGSSFTGNNVYRLGGNNGVTNLFTIGLPGGSASTLTNTTGAFAKNASLVVGGPSTGVGANGSIAPAAIGGTTGTLILNTAQNYGGTTLVNTGSVLEFRGAMSTAGYEVFGTLAAGGSAGTFAGGVNPVMRPGSIVRLDNTFDLTSNAAGRWGDATAVNLDSSTFRLIGNAAADIKEVTGTVNVAGNSFLTPQRSLAGRSTELNIAGLSRTTSGAQLSIEPTNAAQLGTDERVTVAGASLAAQLALIPGAGSVGAGTANGMVAPWLYNNRDTQFLAYSDFGFVNAGFNLAQAAATLAAPLGTGVERLFVSGAVVVPNGGGNINAYALRADASITLATATDAASSITIASGGLITGSAIQINPKLIFGSTGTPTEALIATTNSANTLTIGDSANTLTSGQITATSISKAGDGGLTLQAEQGSFNGPITSTAAPSPLVFQVRRWPTPVRMSAALAAPSS